MLSTILRNAEDLRHPVDAIRIAWIDSDLRVVERPRVAEAATASARRLVAIRQRPCRASIARAIDAAVGFLSLAGVRLFSPCQRTRQCVSLDPCVDDLRIRRRDGDADASFCRLGKAAAPYLTPRGSGISRFP